MTNLHRSYLPGFGFDMITTPGLKSDYRPAALQTALPGPANMHKCMYMCVGAQVCVCVLSMCVCMWAMDGLTEDGGMDGFKCVHVCACVIVCTCVRPRLCACDPLCKDRCIDARSDGWMDRWMDGWMDGLCNGLLNLDAWMG